MEEKYRKFDKLVTRSRAAVGLALLLVIVMTGTVLAVFVPPGDISPAVWDPADNKWENGNPSGYNEGETAAMSVHLDPDLTGTYDVYLCIEVEDGLSYAFSRFGAWDESVLPGNLPGANGGSIISPVPPYSDPLWDDDHPLVYGYNINITNVTPVAKGTNVGGDCGVNYIGVLVTFTKTNTSDAWILFGGRLAQASDPLPPGFSQSSVPPGKGANSINGTFQSRIGGSTGDKTINFSGGSTTAATVDLETTKLCPVEVTNTAPYIISVKNNGPSTANSVSITDVLPAPLTYSAVGTSSKIVKADLTEISPAPGASCGAVGQTVTCTLPTLEAGDTWVITLNTDVPANTPIGTNIPNSATAAVTSPTDSDLDNNTGSTADGGACVTPVTVSYFKATATEDGVTFDWTTSTESGNIGFKLYAADESGLKLINDELILSHVTSSTEPQDYQYQAAGVAGDAFYLETTDITGRIERRGPYSIGETYGERQELVPIDWAAIGAEHKAKAAGRAASAAANGRLSARFQTFGVTATSAAPTAINMAVNTEGIYRVTYDQLKAAGLDLKNANVNSLAVTNAGAPVPIFVNGNGMFSSGEYIEFYGRGIDTYYTADNVYTVQSAGALARRVSTDNATGDRKAMPPTFYMETLVVEVNKSFLDITPTGDPWFNAHVRSGSSAAIANFPFGGVDNYQAGAAPVGVHVDLWGAYDQRHHVGVLLNGTALSNQIFEGITAHPVAVTLPEGVLNDGQNTLTLNLAPRNDMIAYDKLTVVYPRAFVAREGMLTFTGNAATFEVHNLPDKDVVVYRLSGETVERVMKIKTRVVNGTYSAAFRGTGSEATYVVVAEQSVKSPAALVAARPYTDISSGNVNTLIIAHPDFVENLQPLVALREAQGFSVRVVNVDDVYAQYSDAIVDPQAIKEYLTHAINNMGVKMSLLVGSDTLDPRDYWGYGGISFIPSLYAPTGDLIRFAPVDPLYVDANGDSVPDIPIGRLPVRTTAELTNLINKTIAYTGASNDYRTTAVFAADTDFISDSAAMQALLPNWSITSAHIGPNSLGDAKTLLTGEINDGVALTSYFGHSGLTQWTWKNLFRASDALTLNNVGRPTVVTQWGCWNTYYVLPAFNTLAHNLLLADNKGAAAVTGATTLTDARSEAMLGAIMMPLLDDMTLGDAMQQAKAELAQTDPDRQDVLLGWTILGVPWIEVK